MISKSQDDFVRGNSESDLMLSAGCCVCHCRDILHRAISTSLDLLIHPLKYNKADIIHVLGQVLPRTDVFPNHLLGL